MDAQQIRETVEGRSWYHRIEVAPGVTTPGRYDPRTVLDTMGFPKDLTGKTVLDIGCLDGFFSFEAERRGAKSVLATDLHPADHCGFAMARSLLGSKVEYRQTSVYDLDPKDFGMFDVVLFLGVFYHLRHPLLALDRIHSVCREYAFMETHVLDETTFVNEGDRRVPSEMRAVLASSAVLQFYPYDELHNDPSNWFAPTVRCVSLMLQTSGFKPTLAGRWGGRASFHAQREEFLPPFWY